MVLFDIACRQPGVTTEPNPIDTSTQITDSSPKEFDRQTSRWHAPRRCESSLGKAPHSAARYGVDTIQMAEAFAGCQASLLCRRSWSKSVKVLLPSVKVDVQVVEVNDSPARASQWRSSHKGILVKLGDSRAIYDLLKASPVMVSMNRNKIREAERLDHVPRPCDRFDLIGGTSTGGIIAIMLGRLRMTVNECIRAYKNVAKQAFTPKTKTIFQRPRSGAFSTTALETAIKQTVREFCVESDCVERRRQGQMTMGKCPHGDILFRSRSCTKTYVHYCVTVAGIWLISYSSVPAITKHDVDAPPTFFTTYDTSTALDGCTIWQVARATSAATTFFKPIKLGRDEIEFIDAGFGYNNPCEILIGEAYRQFPDREQMQVLSIGTGLGDIVQISGSWTSIITALIDMATSSKKVATALNDRYGGSGQYHRLNIEQGLRDVILSDWEKSSTIAAHTYNYLSEKKREIDTFVKRFVTADQERNTADCREYNMDTTCKVGCRHSGADRVGTVSALGLHPIRGDTPSVTSALRSGREDSSLCKN